MGSKNRLAKDLIPIITKELKPDQWYVEPFVGGANLIDKIEHPLKMGSDNNRYLIALLKAVQDGQQLPDNITRDEYNTVKKNRDQYPDWYVGFVGLLGAYNGCFMKSYAGRTKTKDGKVRNYVKEKINNLLKQDLSNIQFSCSDYRDLIIPPNSVIYCDPPYQGVSSYEDCNFDSDAFWDWCRSKSQEGHRVYISEYNAPDDFTCIWSKDMISHLSHQPKGTTEKLFVYEKIL